MLRPARASAPAPSRAAGFQLGGAVEQLAELERAQLFAGEEVALQAADTTAVQFTADQLEPLPRARLPARPRRSSPGARACCGSTERNETHVQVNRDLRRRVRRGARRRRVGRGAAAGVPAALRRAAGAGLRRRGAPGAHLAQLARRRCAPLAARLNPDLIASGEGGSNLTLVRRGGALGGIVERRELAIHEGRPERRAMAFTRDRVGRLRRQPARDQRRPGARGRRRPARRRAPRSSGPARRRCSSAATSTCARAEDPDALRRAARALRPRRARPGRDAIDHLLARGLEVRSSRRPAWPPERREVARQACALRLSDHAPVEARFETAATRGNEIVTAHPPRPRRRVQMAAKKAASEKS